MHLHCQVATSDSAPAADSAGNNSGQGSSTEGELLGSASPTASSQEDLPERKGSGAAEGKDAGESSVRQILLQKWVILLGVVAAVLLLAGCCLALSRSLSEAVAGLEMLLILSLVAAAVAHRKGWLQESLPPAFRTAGICPL